MFLPIVDAVSFVPAAVAIIMIFTAIAVMYIVLAGGRSILQAIDAAGDSSSEDEDDDPFADYDWSKHDSDDEKQN